MIIFNFHSFRYFLFYDVFNARPNNAMLTASGMKFGFVKTLPHLIGIPLGHIVQINFGLFWSSKFILIYPQIQFMMKILCFVYLLYLGWKMIGSFNIIKKKTGRPLKFYEALFQFINPKAWSIAVAVASGFFPTKKM